MIDDRHGWEDRLTRAFIGDPEVHSALLPILCIGPVSNQAVKFPSPRDMFYGDLVESSLRALVAAARECGPGASPGLMRDTLTVQAITSKGIGPSEVDEVLAQYDELLKIPLDEATRIAKDGAIYALKKMRTQQEIRTATSLTTWDPDEMQDSIAKATAPVLALVAGGSETFLDLAAAWEAGITTIAPTIAALDSISHILYAGAANVFYGPPGGGKTLVAVLAMYCAMREGHTVVFLDFENGHKTILHRFASLGCDMALVIEKLRYVEFPSVAKVQAAQKWAGEKPPGLVAIDSVAKSMGGQGLNEDSASDFLKWSTGMIQPFLAAGAGVLMLDHTIKSGDGNGGFARGSGSKKGDVGGLMLEFMMGEPFAPRTADRPGQAGYVRLKIRKDREGSVGPEGATLGIVKFSPQEVGRTRWEYVAEGSGWVLNTTHRIILSVIEEGPGCTRTRVRQLLREKGRKVGNDAASRFLGELREHGYVREETAGKGHLLFLTESGSKAAS